MAKRKKTNRSRSRSGSGGGGSGRQGSNNGGGGGGYGSRGRGGGGGHQRRGAASSKTPRPVADSSDNGEPGSIAPGTGILELHPNGYGFLRDPKNNYTRVRSDPFVPGTMIDKFRLREGVIITGMVQQNRNKQGPRLKEITDVDGIPPEEYVNVKSFDDLTAINPEQWLNLETGAEPMSTRIMDLLTPLGKGQRSLIVAPPRTGKTVLLQQISQAISTNHPDVTLIVLLIDERPEEVTDMNAMSMAK